jgi:G-protein signaling modulator 2
VLIVVVFLLEQLTPDGKQKSPTPSTNSDPVKTEHLDDEENFFDLLSRFQSERMDDQRCSLTGAADKENRIVSV